MQIRNSFDRDTLIKIGKGAGIAGGAAILTYVANNLAELDLGIYSGIVVAVLSILINLIKEYRKGK